MAVVDRFSINTRHADYLCKSHHVRISRPRPQPLSLPVLSFVAFSSGCLSFTNIYLPVSGICFAFRRRRHFPFLFALVLLLLFFLYALFLRDSEEGWMDYTGDVRLFHRMRGQRKSIFSTASTAMQFIITTLTFCWTGTANCVTWLIEFPPYKSCNLIPGFMQTTLSDQLIIRIPGECNC